ncbi:hypothetical protein KUV86_08370 [Halomonas sp. DP8Y7-3]|uniref:hypothetical protein n=1 Tax=Halomonas sp. DP8Y7-3 TaxID=2859079 RepID=UPI001C97618D|nr:hypothetical protein [Halomonas sp. DP8Y7-3]MBY5929125.1 hypothetical protein [Halomonas sp. DP8Y7-3]
MGQQRLVASMGACLMASLLVGCSSPQPRMASQQNYEYVADIGAAYNYCVGNRLVSPELAGNTQYHITNYLQYAVYNQAKLERIIAEKASAQGPASCAKMQAFVTRQENIRQANNRMAEQQRQQIQQATQAMRQDQASCNTIGGQTFCTQY